MHGKPFYTSSVLDAAGIWALDPAAWDELAANAAADNPFYARQYVLAGLDTIDGRADLHMLAIWSGQGTLAGLFPFRRRFFLPFPWRVAQGAENLYQFSSMPLVARQGAAEVVACWIEAIASRKVPAFWTMGNFNADHELKDLIEHAAVARGLQSRVVIPYPRPHLTGRLADLEAHAGQVIAKSRLKDIQRNLRRLRDMGDLVFERVVEPARLRERLEQFLALEQAGWKGEGGTAFLSDAAHADFARRAFAGCAGETGLAAMDSLLLDGRPIAMSLNIARGRTAFTPKCTYDESLRKYGPGMVLEYLVIERFYADREFADMDAATTTGGHVVLGLWDGQKSMGRLVVGPAGWRTDLLAEGWQAAHRGKQRLKKLLGR
ncbi:GNAT family N-acetyltransferase [Devosia sp.]|uniref:GNAT family N-acetyltransferase n=1 Tax=Devosia sp. TaxID=1871048 RepID=UPI002AFE54B2|nr:GNAT family N-acetyltransferase [Devosia sp.]